MDHSMPASKIMIHRNKRPQMRAGTSVRDAVKLMRVITEQGKIEHGTPSLRFSMITTTCWDW